MKREEVKDILIDEAKRGGICADGLRHILSQDVDSLVDYYLSMPDWCLERNFPDLNTLREKFFDYAHKGVFIDKTFEGEILDDRQVYVFHNCTGTIRVGLNKELSIIPMLYFANGCDMRVEPIKDDFLINRIKVPVYIFGANDINAKSDSYAEFLINKYPLL